MPSRRSQRSPSSGRGVRRPGRPADREGSPDVREQLLDAAGALLTRRGVEAVSLRAIARTAGVTPAMIHYYFGDKRGLFEALLARGLSRVLARVEQVGSLAELFEVLPGTLAAEPWIPPLVLREVLGEDSPMREAFIRDYASQLARIAPRLVRAGIEAGRLRADLDPQLAFLSFLGMNAFPFLARPVVERVFGVDFDAAFLERFTAHTRRLFFEGAAS